MKQVAVIAPDFTPSSYPPALRIRFFARHLPEFGWQPIIVTVDSQHYEWSVDPENLNLLPQWLEVIRTSALPVKLTRKIGIGDISLRSMWYHWHAVKNLCRKNLVDLVFISMPPYFQAVLGRMIYKRFNVPYVIDYIDPWITNNYWNLPRTQRPLKRTLSHTLSLLLEPFALKYAGHIVGVSKGTTDYVVARYPWLKETDTTEIPYGGEAADFNYVRRNPRKNEIFSYHDGCTHLSYIGVCTPAMYVVIRALFEAIRLGLKYAPRLFTRIRFHFVGTTYAANADGLYQVVPLAQEKGVGNLVDERPRRIPYLDALQVMLDSHALVVIGSEATHYTASKIFPYILASRPLLAIFHEASSVVKILKETNAGNVVTFSSEQPLSGNVEKIQKYLEEILSQPREYQSPTKWEAFEQYTTRAMTARLAQAFNKALNKKIGKERDDVTNRKIH